MFDAFRTFGKQNRPFALASRPKSYRSRPPRYPRLWFSLRAYETYRENAARSPCSFLVLRRRGAAGQLLLVSLSPCRSYSSRAASTGSLSTGKGTSCGPLVCLYYIRAAMHGRIFPSARVIVVVLPLPSVLNVFPSVEPTTIVNVCSQFAGFEQTDIPKQYIALVVATFFFSFFFFVLLFLPASAHMLPRAIAPACW